MKDSELDSIGFFLEEIQIRLHLISRKKLIKWREEEEWKKIDYLPHFLTKYISSNPIILKFSLQGLGDAAWTVGCYKINPTTHTGQKFFILHMLGANLSTKAFWADRIKSHNHFINTFFSYKKSTTICCQCCPSSPSRPWSSRTAWPWTASWVTRPGWAWSGNRWVYCTVYCNCNVYCAGQGCHGDRPLYPEHPGGARRGGPLHLHKPVQCSNRHTARDK